MTPLEISVAIHYWCFPTPYKGGSENWNELECKIVTDMIVHHMLEKQGDNLTGNTPAMRCFMEALQAVPWPSIKWVCEPSPVTVTGSQ